MAKIKTDFKNAIRKINKTRGIWDQDFIRANSAIAKLVIDKYKILPRPIGTIGIPVPHFHLGGKIYTLTNPQWMDFSDRVKTRLMSDISKINKINMNGLAVLSATVASMKK